jgi:hypothetical protein
MDQLFNVFWLFLIIVAVTVEEARRLGLRVNSEMPKEVYDLMALYRQAGTRRLAVD